MILLGWITKGRKKFNTENKMTTGKIEFQNDMGDHVGQIDFRAMADSDKIRKAKMLKISSEVNGQPMESKEIDIS